jgi:tetratricopeptide (TPR) repeat protein
VIKPTNDLAFAIEDAGLFERAEALRRDTLAAELRLLPEGHPTLALARHNLARVLYRQGELVEAEELARQASSALSASLGPDHTESLVAAFNLGLVLRERGDSAAALEVFSRQLDVLGERLGPAHPRVRTLRSIAGQAALDQGRLAFAESLAEALRADPRGPHEHLFLARVALARGRPGATLALLEQWDQLTEGTLRQRLRIEGRLWQGLAEVELQGRLSSETESSLAAASGSTPRLAQLAESIQRRLGGKSPESP